MEIARRLASAVFSGSPLSGLSWRKEAACRYVDPDMFWRADVRHALGVCARCAVQPDCLAEVLSLQDDPGGVWGGTTHAQRRALRRRAGLSHTCAHCGGPCSSLSAKYCSDLCPARW